MQNFKWHENIKVSNDQEIVQSERNSHSKNRTRKDKLASRV